MHIFIFSFIPLTTIDKECLCNFVYYSGQLPNFFIIELLFLNSIGKELKEGKDSIIFAPYYKV